jgi:hypothetical protein
MRKSFLFHWSNDFSPIKFFLKRTNLKKKRLMLFEHDQSLGKRKDFQKKNEKKPKEKNVRVNETIKQNGTKTCYGLDELNFTLCGRLAEPHSYYTEIIRKRKGEVSETGNVIVLPDNSVFDGPKIFPQTDKQRVMSKGCILSETELGVSKNKEKKKQPTKKLQRALLNKPVIISESKLRELLCLDDKKDDYVLIADVISDEVIFVDKEEKRFVQKRIVHLRTKKGSEEVQKRVDEFLKLSQKYMTPEVLDSIEKEWKDVSPSKVYDSLIYKFVDVE